MSKSFVIAVLVFACCAIIAQPIHDYEFGMEVIADCELQELHEPIYSKVEVDPVVHSVSKADFHSQLSLAVKQLELGDRSFGTIKLKLWFLTNSISCLRAVGFHGLAVNDSVAASILVSHLPTISNFTAGRQKSQPQNCEGLVFLSINHGSIETSRIANFSFSSN